MKNDYKKKVASAIAAGALLLQLATPTFAGVTLEVSGNGSDSDNEVEVEFENKTEVTQTNVANVLNDVQVKANTGDNEAEDNTGGDVEIDTGDAETYVSVSNTLNNNSAKVDQCCVAGDVDVKISGNGSDSDNEVELELENEVEIEQANEANVWNYVESKAETGDNEAEDNTGGDVKISTGNAEAGVSVSTTANSNSAWVHGDGNGGSLSAIISGNGSDSDNEIELELENETELEQGNLAYILNDVEVELETGDNEAEDNTGGEVEIETGDALVGKDGEPGVTVDNMVNFNWADIDGCGCIEDLLAKIHGNGTDSENEIEAELESKLEAEQANDFDCKDEERDACASVDVELETGDNEAEDNTTGEDEDPLIETGDAVGSVDVDNVGNSNVFGDAPEHEWDSPWGGFGLSISLDFGDLLDLLGL